MNQQIKTILPLAAFALTATYANAAVIATLTTEAKNGEPHTGPSILATTGDLLETEGSVASEGGNGDGIRQNTSTVFDGSISTGIANGAQTAANAGGYWGAGHFIEIDLDITPIRLAMTFQVLRPSRWATASGQVRPTRFSSAPWAGVSPISSPFQIKVPGGM